MDASTSKKLPHPFWPRDLVIPSYVANDRSMSEILVFLFSVSGVFLLVTWLITGITGKLSTLRRLAICWFAVCGFIHGVIEGWFSLYYDILPGDQSFLSQLCKYHQKKANQLHFRHVLLMLKVICIVFISLRERVLQRGQ